MKKRYKILIIIAAVAVVLMAGLSIAMKVIETNLESTLSLEIVNVDVSQVANGSYRGSFDAFPIQVEVVVDVEDKRITAIELVKHNNGRGAGAEVILDEVVQSQSLDVDLIAGATYSSKVILKAIENALTGATK